MKKILFVSHDASRTGAPIIFLNFLKWFKANTDIPFQILLKNGGELESEFAAIAPVNVFYQKSASKNLVFRILRRLGLESHYKNSNFNRLSQKLIKENIGLIYSNTVANGEVLEFLSILKCPIISHVHELDWTIRYYIGLKGFQKVKEYTQKYIAVSKSVKNNLIQNHDICSDKISTIYGFVPQNPSILDRQEQTKKLIFQQLNIPQSAKIVAASGTTGWRKGTDLFIQLANTISQKYFDDPVYFLWIGGQKEGLHFSEYWHDVQNLGLEKNMRFLGIKSNPLDYFAVCDVFALVSREDPFPLVCLEAAFLEKPIVCFDNAGGEKEFVKDDCGFVVPYLDIQTMADKIILLLDNVKLREQMGNRAMQKAKDQHDPNLICHKITQEIKQLI